LIYITIKAVWKHTDKIVHRVQALYGKVLVAINSCRRQYPIRLDAITEFLDISNYKVTHVIQNYGSILHFIVERKVPLSPVCSGCESTHAEGIHSIGTSIIEVLPIRKLAGILV
jgi:hypothetical protein